MRSSLLGYSAAALLSCALAPAASAQFFDNFDSYTAGTPIEGMNGFEFWGSCGGTQPINTVSNAQASSPANSLRLVGDPTCPGCSDTINELNGPYSAGQYTFSLQSYVPSTLSDQAYIILLSGYDGCTQTYNWNSQVHFDPTTGNVVSDGVSPQNAVNGNVPIIFDTWVEYKIEIDLDATTFRSFYDGVEMWEGTWTGGLEALDLYSLDMTTEWFVDDIRLSQGIVGTIGNSYCMAAPNSTGGVGTLSGFGSTAVAANDVTLTATGLPSNQFGIFIVSDTAGFVPGAGGTSNGNICISGGIGRYSNPGEILGSGSAGEFSFAIDTMAIRRPNNNVAAVPGQTWFFQAWHRDGVGLGSNFTEGISITFN